MNNNKEDILAQLERGEITADQAAEQIANDTAAPIDHEPVATTTLNAPPPKVPTRQQRLGTLAERIGAWEPQHLVALDTKAEARPWPWPEEAWQWFWQDFSHPQHIDHQLDLAEGSHLDIFLYQGNMRLSGSEQPTFTLGAGAFDVRLGRDERHLRLAASTGTLDMRVPRTAGQVTLHTQPGDIYARHLWVQQLEVKCQSGLFRAEQIRGSLEAQLHGSDAELADIEGEIRINAKNGAIRLSRVKSDRVELAADTGIVLNLDRVDRGHFSCQTQNGDIEVVLAADSACQLAAQATDGGTICPVDLPWSDLAERSPQSLKGTLGNGGATIELSTQSGCIYLSGR